MQKRGKKVTNVPKLFYPYFRKEDNRFFSIVFSTTMKIATICAHNLHITCTLRITLNRKGICALHIIHMSIFTCLQVSRKCLQVLEHVSSNT